MADQKGHGKKKKKREDEKKKGPLEGAKKSEGRKPDQDSRDGVRMIVMGTSEKGSRIKKRSGRGVTLG